MGKTYRIAVVPGDGTSPEVIREGLKVLDAAEAQFGFATQRTTYDLGAERYSRTGETLTDGELDELRKMDAIYFGAVGLPDKVPPGVLERGIILKLRFELDQYINLRPIKLYPGVPCPIKDKGPEDVDFVVVGENTEGLYAGAGGFLKKGTPDEVALQTSINTRKGVERCMRYAYEYARRRPRKKLTFCGKTNVLTYAHDLWQRVFDEVGAEYPDVEKDYEHVDAWCLLAMQSPELFDVIVTDNQLRDIITDLAAVLQGGLGVAASGNLNPEGVSMFEPIGGTAPAFTGKNVINPMAAIGALQMMLAHIGEGDAASSVEAAMAETFLQLKGMGAGEMGYSTSEVGDLVAQRIAH
ncbi:MAG: 3-isopropylmalate dehydrogenase [Actinomycetota bacterium]